MNNTIGKSTTEVIKTLAYQYKRRKDQLDTLNNIDLSELINLISYNYSSIGQNVEFMTDKLAMSKYNIDLNDYNSVFDFYRRNHLLISKDNNNSPLLMGIYNLWFRAWHDTIHFDNSFPFDFMGEFLTWEKHCEGVDNETVKKILFSEIVLQACYFLTFGEFPKVQKVVLLEDYYIDLATELIYFNSPKN